MIPHIQYQYHCQSQESLLSIFVTSYTHKHTTDCLEVGVVCETEHSAHAHRFPSSLPIHSKLLLVACPYQHKERDQISALSCIDCASYSNVSVDTAVTTFILQSPGEEQ